MEKEGALIIKSAPPAKIISLNLHATELLIEAEKKLRQEFLRQHRWMKVFLQDYSTKSSSTFSVLLVFGSYAKGKQTVHSDIDMLLIVPKKDDVEVMEKMVYSIPLKIKKQSIVVEEKDFHEMISNSNKFNVGNEARKHHIILYGDEQYYALLVKTLL